MRWTRIAVIAAALVLVLLAVLVRGRPDQPESQLQFDSEPMVTVAGVGEMPIEEYVMGVVGGEMGRLPAAGETEESDWPDEAYASQAILARSFILAWLQENDWKPISTDVTEAQAYNPDNITDAIRRGVERTRGEVMLDRNGAPVQAYFHSYAGGYTATAQEGLNRDDEPEWILSRSVPENEYVPEDVKSWRASIPLERVAGALAELGVNVGQIEAIEIAEMGPSDRITRLRIVGSAGTAEVHGADFRVAVGPEEFRSTRVNPDTFGVEGGHLVAEGKGFGHGVGLSQWDAYKMARDGRKAEDIIEFFFDNISIQRLWE